MERQPTGNSNGPKANGYYLTGAELTPGTWMCGKPSDLIYRAERDRGCDLIHKVARLRLAARSLGECQGTGIAFHEPKGVVGAPWQMLR